MDKTEKKISDKISDEASKDFPSKNLASQIKNATEGLFYISETDADIVPFVGKAAEKADKDELLKQVGAASDSEVEERNFSDFFTRLTKIQDWFDDEEKERARKFAQLKEVLENNIRDLKVYKVGRVELDVYAVGLDAENTLIGVQTKAVET